MDFFETEIKKLVESDIELQNASLLTIQFIPYSQEVSFLISAQPTMALKSLNIEKDYRLDLFKENGIQAQSLSNL